MHRRILSILLAVAMLCTSLTPLYAQSNPLVIELPEGDVTYEQLQAMEEIAGLYGFAEADISFDSDELISVIVMFNNKPAPVEKAIAAGEGFIVPQSAMLSLETKASNDKVIFKAGLDEIFGNKQPVSPFVPIAPAGGTLEPQPAPYYLTFEYDVAINATAMLVPANKIPDLLDISSVAAVFYDAPHYAEDYNTEEIDIEEIMAAAVGNGSANNKVSLMGYEAPLAHAQGITGKGVTVGVVDSGVTYTHPDLKDAFFWFDTLEEVAAHNPKWVSRVHQVNGKYVYYGANVFDQMYYPYTNAPHPWPEIRRTPGNNYPGIALTNPTATTSANAVVWNHPDNTRGAWDPFETTAAERARMVSGGYGHNAMGYHGTHVSGIILARGNGTPFSSGLSTVGVAPEANLIGYKIGTPSGDGSDAAVIKALELGIDDGVKVFNYSYGFSYYPYTVSPLGLALNYAIYTYDIVFCKSAGNDGASSRTMGGPMAALAFIIGSGTYTALNGDFKVGDATFRGSFIYTNLATDFVPVLDGAQNVHAWILKGPNATANDDLSYDFFLMPPSGTAASAGLGSGIAADFNALTPQQREDIKGKIVVIGRPTTGAETITTTITRVATYGAAALVVVDPTSGTAVTKTWSASSSAQNNASYVPTFAFTNAVGTNFVNALRAAETPNGLLYSMNANGLYGISSFSSRGPIDDSYLIAPDILTPGTSIWSTYPYHSAASGYSNISGTSMSSPFAAGLSALVLSKDLIDNGEYTMKAHEVKARLTNTADRTILTGNYGINEIGPGAPHISKAVNATSFATCDEQVAILALKEIVEDRAFEYVTGERTSFSFRATYVGAQAHERTLTGNLYNKADYEKSYSLSFVRNTASNSSTQNVRNSTKFVPTFPETVITVP
ncbi:MAG: S8 family serine peptidase, partial [Symbiobacteriaceae bacterium]|nr:S8 family serine peptidase [Symbiobacteriaceae bacterium]